jgi:hypothetical protein
MIPIDEQIEHMQRMVDSGKHGGWRDIGILASLERLKAIDSVQVPDYPTVWAGGGAGPHVDKKDYDTLRDLLRSESFLRKEATLKQAGLENQVFVFSDALGETLKRAEAAEAKLAQIEKMGREPSAGMMDAGNEVILNRSNTLYVSRRAWRRMFAKMMEELK